MSFQCVITIVFAIAGCCCPRPHAEEAKNPAPSGDTDYKNRPAAAQLDDSKRLPPTGPAFAIPPSALALLADNIEVTEKQRDGSLVVPEKTKKLEMVIRPQHVFPPLKEENLEGRYILYTQHKGDWIPTQVQKEVTLGIKDSLTISLPLPPTGEYGFEWRPLRYGNPDVKPLLVKFVAR